ncbi:MAG: hypothetical protein ACI80L_000870 [Pseudohongiellaceae bacterium]|jgi:hypothetical protein
MKIRTVLLLPAALSTVAFSSMALSQEIVTITPAPSPIAPTPDTVASLSSAYTVSTLLAASLRDSGEREFEVYQRLESADTLKNRYRHSFFTDINREISTDASLAIREHMSSSPRNHMPMRIRGQI